MSRCLDLPSAVFFTKFLGSGSLVVNSHDNLGESEQIHMGVVGVGGPSKIYIMWPTRIREDYVTPSPEK